MPNDVVIRREELYEAVWTTPIRQLAGQYGLSDVGLAKICNSLNVPRPGLGYWAKVEAGQQVPRTPLPARALRQSYVIRVKPPAPPPSAEELAAREAHTQLVEKFSSVKVPDVLGQPHVLTRRTQAHFDKIAKELRRPRKWGTPDYLNRPHDDNGRYHCSVQEGFPILVSLEALDRALRILDTLAKELERLGFKLAPDTKTEVLQLQREGEVFALGLREGYKKRDLTAEEVQERKKQGRYASDWEWTGSGRLVLTIRASEYGATMEWPDARTPLEERLPEILAGMVEAIPRQKRLREERLAEEKRRAEERQKEWQAEVRRREAQSLFDGLAAEADEVEKAESVLRYLGHLEAELGAGISPKAKEWIAHAREIAMARNPMPARLKSLAGS